MKTFRIIYIQRSYIFFLVLVKNTNVLLCLRNKWERPNSIYLILLDVVDIISIWLYILDILITLFDYRRSLTHFNFALLLSLFLNYLSSWISMLISFERLLSVFFSVNCSERFKENYFLQFYCIFSSFNLFGCTFCHFNVSIFRFDTMTAFVYYRFYSYIPAAIFIQNTTQIQYKLRRRPNFGQRDQQSIKSQKVICLVITINVIFLHATFSMSIITTRNIADIREIIVLKTESLITNSLSCINRSFYCIMYFYISKQFRVKT